MAQIARKIISEAAERRSSPRPELGRPGTIRIGAEAPINVLVRDLTREGCRIKMGAELLPNLDVQVGLAHIGLTAGRIVWRSDAEYGCRFDVPLAPGTITAAYGASNVAVFPLITETSRTSGKLSPRTRLLFIAGLATILWGAIATIVLVG